jgi:hypothetical protein
LRSSIKKQFGTQFNVAPILDLIVMLILDTPLITQRFKGETPTIQVDSNLILFFDDKVISIMHRQVQQKAELTTNWESLYVALETRDNQPPISILALKQKKSRPPFI